MSSRSNQTKESALTRGRIVAGILVVLVVVFAALNSQSVRMHWIVTTTETPLFVLILLFTAIGLAIGYVLGRRRR
jgi:uncharacterized integral membrane protein